jgi:amino acid transporter
MDEGIGAIILLLSVLSLSVFLFVVVGDEALFAAFLILFILLVFLLVYACVIVLSARWDKYKQKKDWDFLEEMEKIRPPIEES